MGLATALVGADNFCFYHRGHGGARRFFLSVFLCALRGEFCVFIFFLI
jgi:hypothetical protein